MDREQEDMQFLGLLGVYEEACKVIFTWRKIMTQITLSLILPLSFIFLAHMEVSHIIFGKILRNEFYLSETQENSPQHKRISNLLSSEWTAFWLFKLAYFTFVLIFSLLSTSAVVYTVASAYTGRDITFNKVMSVVPKVWKRLMVTFLCMYAAFFAYNVVAVLVIVLWLVMIGLKNGGSGIFVVILIFYFVGLVYLTIVWRLAGVVSVLEESYGTKAMLKSRELMKGKMWLAIIVFFFFNLSFLFLEYGFKRLVVHDWGQGIGVRAVFGVTCFVLLCFFFLFGLVIETVLYFVCKSYHHENIDKSALSDHLEVYLGEYVPLKAKDVQLEQYHV